MQRRQDLQRLRRGHRRRRGRRDHAHGRENVGDSDLGLSTESARRPAHEHRLRHARAHVHEPEVPLNVLKRRDDVTLLCARRQDAVRHLAQDLLLSEPLRRVPQVIGDAGERLERHVSVLRLLPRGSGGRAASVEVAVFVAVTRRRRHVERVASRLDRLQSESDHLCSAQCTSDTRHTPGTNEAMRSIFVSDGLPLGGGDTLTV